MAKRFTDTEKYKKPFIRGLQGAYKLFWDYLYHSCDHAGIWIVDFEIAQIYLGKDMLINKLDSLKYFNEGEIRIIEICEGQKWFLPSFVDFQYGILNENNRAHNSVILILNKYKLIKNKGLTRGLQAHKDKDKVKDKVKDKDKESSLYNLLKEYYTNNLIENDNFSKEAINNIIFESKKERDNLASLLKKFTSLQDFKYFLWQGRHDKWITETAKSFLPAILNNQYSRLMEKVEKEKI